MVQKNQDPTAFYPIAYYLPICASHLASTMVLLRLAVAAGERAHPESGAPSYVYDLNSNVTSRTDARGVITNYAYDQLNRPVQKSYTNDSSHTVAVKYGHDGVAGTYSCPPAFTSANPVGKRTAMCDAAGVESWSYPITANVGWKTIDQRKTNNVTETITTQDNLDGSVATLTYPSGRVVTYTPGRAGRPLAAADSSNSYVTNATYAPFGALTGMNNGSSITVNNSYNTRMQPQSLGATGVPAPF